MAEPFLAHSELTGEIYVIVGKEKYNVTEQAKKAVRAVSKEKCKWTHYDHRTICPKYHDIDNPYWRIPEDRMDVLKHCPYCGREIEID